MQNAREDQHDADLRAQVGAFGATPPLSPENPSAEQTDDLPPYPDLDPDMTAHQLDDGSSEDDHEPPQEGEDRNEELILLDPEHPLNKRFQEAKRTYLRKRLEGLQQELRKKRAVKKEEDRKLQDTGTKLFGIQEELGRAENKLRDSQQSTANAEVQRQHAHDQLEKTKSKFSNMSSQISHDKTKVSRLQAELEKKLQQVTFTQAVNEELHSKVKIMDNARHKLGTKKTQAEEEKIKQDLYVERLTKDLDSKTLQVAGYEVQRSAQAQETQEVTEALCEAEMELESLLIMHKKLLQQWNSNITDIRRHDETVNAMLEAVRAVEDEMILLDREIEGYKKCVDAEQKNNETLTFQLSRSQMDCVTWEKLISQKQMDGMALQAQYSACLHSLSETKQIFGTLTKEMGAHQAELNSQRNQVEKLSAARLELEEKIMAHIQQQLTHSKAATYSQHLISKMATQKKEKMNQLQQLERDVLSVKLESQRVEQQVNSLTLTVETLDEKINKYNKLLTSHENTFSLTVREIKQKETTINYLKNRISKIVESTGHEDLGPLQIRIQKILTEIEELAAHIKNEQHLWMLFQGTLVALTRELETNNKKMRKLQKDYTGLQQKEIRLENLTKQEERDQAEMEKNLKLLRRDLEKLCKLKKKNTECSETLELESTQMETDFKNKLKEAEQESASIQMKLEKTQEEKENLLKCLLEAEQQIMLWEKKTQILKETRSVVDSEMNQGEIRKMKAEIHRMELQVSKLTKQQEQLMRESEKAVSRRENLDMRKDTMIRDRHKEYTKEELKRTTDFLQRKVQKTVREVADCEQTVKELESNKTILSEKIWGQKQHLTGLSCIKTKLEDDLMKLQEDKNMNQIYLFAMQSRNKKLQEVCAGGYKISSGSETLEVTLLSQRQRLEDYSEILRRSCGDFPRHQAALRRITRAAEAYLKVFNQ